MSQTDTPSRQYIGQGTAVLIYDGDCPICSNYARYTRIRQAFPNLIVQSAREQQSSWVMEAKKAGINLNKEMVLLLDGQWIRGGQVVRILASLGSPGLAERTLSAFIGSGRFSETRYNVLVFLRRCLLWLLGRKPL